MDTQKQLLTLCQVVDAQLDGREVALADLATQLVKTNPPSQHQVTHDLLVVGHVIDNPLKWRLPHSLRFRHLWDSASGSGGLRLDCLLLLWGLILVYSGHFLLWPQLCFDALKWRIRNENDVRPECRSLLILRHCNPVSSRTVLVGVLCY